MYEAIPATQSNCIDWPRAVVLPPPRNRFEITETAQTRMRIKIETMILNKRIFSSTPDASSIIGRESPAPNSESTLTSVSLKLEATPAIESPSFVTIAIVTFKLVTQAISKPSATPRMVFAESDLRCRNESKLPTERETSSAVRAGCPEECEPSM